MLIEFSKSHDSAATAKLLDGYSGFLVADAHVVYDHLYRDGQVIEVGVGRTVAATSSKPSHPVQRLD